MPFPDPGIEPASPSLAGRFFNTEPPGKPSVGHREPIKIAKAKKKKLLKQKNGCHDEILDKTDCSGGWTEEHRGLSTKKNLLEAIVTVGTEDNGWV